MGCPDAEARPLHCANVTAALGRGPASGVGGIEQHRRYGSLWQDLLFQLLRKPCTQSVGHLAVDPLDQSFIQISRFLDVTHRVKRVRP